MSLPLPLLLLWEFVKTLFEPFLFCFVCRAKESFHEDCNRVSFKSNDTCRHALSHPVRMYYKSCSFARIEFCSVSCSTQVCHFRGITKHCWFKLDIIDDDTRNMMHLYVYPHRSLCHLSLCLCFRHLLCIFWNVFNSG